MKSASPYTRDYFAETEGPSARRSAEALVPVVLSLLQPQSVVDVGCGTGEFLRVFASHEVMDILGIDGDYMDRSLLAIPDAQFLPLDIRQPICLSRTFDLALCMEVAEHLEAEFADRLVDSLVRLAPVILFSAAIPGQGGLHHVNEQWPDYWAAFFETHRYRLVDALRKRIWDDERIFPWYRQNIFLYCSEEVLVQSPILACEAEATSRRMLSLVHPEFYHPEFYNLPGPSVVDQLRLQVRKITPLRALYRCIKYRALGGQRPGQL